MSKPKKALIFLGSVEFFLISFATLAQDEQKATSDRFGSFYLPFGIRSRRSAVVTFACIHSVRCPNHLNCFRVESVISKRQSAQQMIECSVRGDRRAAEMRREARDAGA